MKRAHRKAHLLIWAFLAPALAAIIILSLLYRQPDPVNEALPDLLPDLLIEEAR